jgi:hypothetical protein
MRRLFSLSPSPIRNKKTIKVSTTGRSSIVERSFSFQTEHWINKSPSLKSVFVPSVATDYLARILTSQVYEVAHETPTQFAANISSLIGNEVYLKREDTQPVFSFKIRGAYNKVPILNL